MISYFPFGEQYLRASFSAPSTASVPLLQRKTLSKPESDFNFSATDQRGTKSGFNEGQFTLHTASALSKKVTVFGELTLTARPDAGTGTPPAPGFNAEVERIVIRYDQSDYFKVSFGPFGSG